MFHRGVRSASNKIRQFENGALIVRRSGPSALHGRARRFSSSANDTANLKETSMNPRPREDRIPRFPRSISAFHQHRRCNSRAAVGDVASQMRLSSPLTRTDASSAAGRSLEKENCFVRAIGNPADGREVVDKGGRVVAPRAQHRGGLSLAHGHSRPCQPLRICMKLTPSLPTAPRLVGCSWPKFPKSLRGLRCNTGAARATCMCTRACNPVYSRVERRKGVREGIGNRGAIISLAEQQLNSRSHEASSHRGAMPRRSAVARKRRWPVVAYAMRDNFVCELRIIVLNN